MQGAEPGRDAGSIVGLTADSPARHGDGGRIPRHVWCLRDEGCTPAQSPSGTLMSSHAARLAWGLIALLLLDSSAIARPGDVTLRGVRLDVLGAEEVTLQVVDLDGD